MPKTPNLLREHEAAAYLNVSKKTMANWRAIGKGPVALKLSTVIRYSIVDLDAYIAQSEISQ